MLVDKKISDTEKNQYNVKSVQGSRLKGTVQENKNIFDRLVEFFAGKYNGLVDEVISDVAADQIGAGEIIELRDPDDTTKSAKTVWRQIKALLQLILNTQTTQNAHAERRDNPHEVTKTQAGLGNVINELQATKMEFDVLTGRVSAQETNYDNLGTAAHKNADNTAGNVPLIGADGKIDGGLVPAIAFNEVKVFSSIAERDKWSDAREGDSAVVTNDNAYMMTATGWVPIPHPTDLVTSVAGRAGDIKLTVSDVANAVAVSDIVDNLSSMEPKKPLSAHMGYLLDYYARDVARIASDGFDRQGQAITKLQTEKATGSGVVLRMAGRTLEYRDQLDPDWHSQDVGPQGIKGDKGDRGQEGPQGIQGRDGAQGAQGLTGPQGAKGQEGPQGAQGLQGLTGPQGLQGLTGPQGLQGIQGPQGVKGDKGDRGDSGITVSVDSFYTMYINGAGDLVVSMADESATCPLRLDSNGNLIYTVS